MRRLALFCLLVVAMPAPATPLGETLYPGLVEFDEAFGFYSAGDFERARVGFRHLAELGDSEAQLNLGVMVAKGEGGPVDRIEGAAWVRRAEEGGMEQAAAIREILEQGLEEVQLDEIAARLEALRDPAAAESSSPVASAESSSPAAEGEPELVALRRVPPNFPGNELSRQFRVGSVILEGAVDADGIAGAVHSLYGFNKRNPFALAAERAVTDWLFAPYRAHDFFLQQITFDFEPADTEARRKYGARILEEARRGDAAMGFHITLLARGYPDFFEFSEGEDASFALAAAVAGLPEARFWLNSRRWMLLAARQGHAPALFRIYRWKALPLAERKAAVIAAARGNHEGAVLHAVQWLAAHPEAAERDGALALELTQGLSRRQLSNDALLAQARAMALAETGEFRDAARLQARVVRLLQKSDRPTRLAEERLHAYTSGKAWRDPTLVEELGLIRKE